MFWSWNFHFFVESMFRFSVVACDFLISGCFRVENLALGFGNFENFENLRIMDFWKVPGKFFGGGGGEGGLWKVPGWRVEPTHV